MKTLSALHIIVIIGLCVSPVCMAVENPNVSTSFSASTTVPSQGQQRRFLTRPNPLDASGNNVITGNVGGMRYFHGVVPYGSQYYTGNNLNDAGSDSVTSFLRRSTNPVLTDRNPGQARVFYDPSRVNSSFYEQNGHQSALSQSLIGEHRNENPYSPSVMSQLLNSEAMQRPLSTNNQELDQILSRQEQLKEAAKQSALENLTENKSEYQNFFEVTPPPEDLQNLLPEKRQQETKIEKEKQNATENTERDTLGNPQIEPDTMLTEQQQPIQEEFLNEDENKPAETDESSADLIKKQQDETNSQIDIHSQAERIRGEHKTFVDLSQAKFSGYMKTAEEFMREGKFYKAADAYSLAAIWKPEDARPYAGQSFSLFAAGEYMSSAYYLSRAIEIDPEIAAKKYDLVGLVGERDIFENRLIEISTWQERSGSGELAFLMAYILYHDGKPEQAKEAIVKAEEKMPDSKAVSILKNVIIPESRTQP